MCLCKSELRMKRGLLSWLLLKGSLNIPILFRKETLAKFLSEIKSVKSSFRIFRELFIA